MGIKVFVDGEAGTTGMQIHERLADIPDIELLRIGEQLHRDNTERARLLNAADLVFLCLPDDAAREAVSLIKNDNTRVIDASTAHRCDDGWVYGFPELDKSQRGRIAASSRVAVPGCYATGFTSAVHPLLSEDIIGPDYPITVNAVSGYTGAGKKMVARYEQGRNGSAEDSLSSTRFYSLGLAHKHLPEMVKINGLDFPPVFVPSIGDFARGMLVALPLTRRLFRKRITAFGLHRLYSRYYEGERFVQVMPFGCEGGFEGGYLDPMGCNGTNRLELYIFGGEEQMLVVSRLDNLGKGASGAAVQCMNIMLGRDEAAGLDR